MAEARTLSDYEDATTNKITIVKKDFPPKKKKKPAYLRYSRYLAFILMAVALLTSLVRISMQNRISQVSEKIVQIQQKNDQLQENISELQQEKNELSRVDRIMKIAKEGGLVVNDNNIRKVMPNEAK